MPEISSVIKIPKISKMSYRRALGLGSEKSYKRSRLIIFETEGALTIKISAKDIAALRAGINSITRDIQVIDQTAPKVPEKSKK